MGIGVDKCHNIGLYYKDFTIDDSYVYEGIVIGL